MEEFKKVESLVDHVKEYVHVRTDEVRLGIAERSSAVVAALVAGTIVTAIFFLCYIFLGIGAAIWVGRILNNPIAGYLLVALLQFVIGLIIWAGRGPLIRMPVFNAILHQLLIKTQHDDEN